MKINFKYLDPHRLEDIRAGKKNKFWLYHAGSLSSRCDKLDNNLLDAKRLLYYKAKDRFFRDEAANMVIQILSKHIDTVYIVCQVNKNFDWLAPAGCDVMINFYFHVCFKNKQDLSIFKMLCEKELADSYLCPAGYFNSDGYGPFSEVFIGI